MAGRKPIQLEMFPQRQVLRKGAGNVRLFTTEEEKQITADYEKNPFLADLVRRWGGTKATLSAVIKRNGGKVLGRVEAYRIYKSLFDEEGEERIRKEYEACRNSATVAKKYNIPSVTVRAIVRRAGGKVSRRKHALNHAAFDDAENNPLAAYFVGLLFADGCVCPRRSGETTIALSLHHEDRELVEAFRSFLGASHKLSRNGNMVQIHVHSDRLAADLAKHGVVPRKSLTATVSDALMLNRHFWRGVVDGDGCLHCSGRYNRSVDVTGSRHTCDSFLRFVNTLVECNAKPIRHINVWRIRVSASKASRVAEYLYRDGELWLTRKRRVADKIIALNALLSKCSPRR